MKSIISFKVIVKWSLSSNFLPLLLSQSKIWPIRKLIDLFIAEIFLISLGSSNFNIFPPFLLYFWTILSFIHLLPGKESGSISTTSKSLFFSLSIISFSLHISVNSGMILILLALSSEDLISITLSVFSFFSINLILLMSMTSLWVSSLLVLLSLLSSIILISWLLSSSSASASASSSSNSSSSSFT